MSAVTHLLKVLNGPHTGAQSGFGNGEDLLIGNSAEADIILSDPHILPQHCRIKLSGNECVVIPLDGEVFVSGKSVVAPEPIDAGRVVTIGSTSFVVGAKDALWPPLVIPDLKNIGRLSELGRDTSGDSPADSKTATSPLRILLICLAVLSVIIFAASVITAKSSRKPAAPEYPGTVEDKIEEHTDVRAGDALMTIEQNFQREMPGVKTFRNSKPPHGELVVLAPDEETTLKARQLAGSFRKALYIQVINLAEVNALLKEICRMKAPQVTAVLQPDGILLWKGYLKSRSLYPMLKNEVRQDLPFINKDDDKIGYGEDLVPRISSILSTAGISAGINVTPEDQGIAVTGDISPEKSSHLKSVLSQISAQYPDVHFENKAGMTAGGAEIEKVLGGRVAGITFGKSAWIELVNGVRLFAGSRVANGMTLIAITETEIIFQTPNGIMKMPVETVTAQPAPLPSH
jgi:type III secretion system YscD/HrpQ family protein